ncbi:cytochrome P450 [Gigaspora margarita]|uniref:Cytochrome P450 n=1 Tax=Gigaspora margarita TaxID=4874 RepID=A0A8H4EH81_GIGMA|nr:cytochrome P450 [Gigaspora margarita]
MAVISFIFALKFTDYLNLIVLSFLIYVFHFYYKYFTRPNKLPGPLPLPFIECSYLFKSDAKQLFISLHEKYGDICEIYLGGLRRISISRPEYIENMLTHSATDTTFMIRWPYSEGLEELGVAGRGLLFNHDIKSWRYNRQFFNKAIQSPSFNLEAIKWVDKIFQELEGYWESLANARSSSDISLDNKHKWSLETDLSLWTNSFTNDIIIVLTTGERSYSMASLYNKLSPIKVNISDALIEDSDRFVRGIKEHTLVASYFTFLVSSLRHYIPFIRNNIKSLVENKDFLYEKLELIVKKRRTEIEETPIGEKLRNDLLTSLIIANTKRDMDDLKTVEGEIFRPLTDIEIRGNMLDACLGGTNASANLFGFLTYYICQYPQVKQKMLAEIDSIFPQNTCINHDDLFKLDYCVAIIKEVSRIMPVVSLLARYTNNPCKIAGYKWDAGTMFHVNLYGVHMHKDHWTNPDTFDPDRFYNKNDEIGRYKFSFTMWGGGLRICPGRKLAMIELLSLMVLIFRKYNVELVNEKLPLNSITSLVTFCEKLLVRITPRN